MAVDTQWNVDAKDLACLRELARRKVELAHDPVNLERRRLWYRLDAGAAERPMVLAIHYDNATEVYVNGQQVWSGTGWNDNYASFDITETLRHALKSGKNLVAVHCHQDEGGQFIDRALLVEVK